MKPHFLGLALIWACGGGGSDSGAGPALTESEYLSEYPAQFCSVLEQCDPAVFDASYDDDLQACVDEITTVGRDRINQGCAFNGAAAAACVSALKSVDCTAWSNGDYQDDCGAIIDC